MSFCALRKQGRAKEDTFSRKRGFSMGGWCRLLCLLCWLVSRQHHVTADESRPYEFSFNVIDFQHRFEKKDAEGIITGEYGFITADGVYHETGYATDKNGDFIITRMRNRKITSLKDAQEIFKDRPEAARKLIEAVARACSNCKIPIKQEDDRKKLTITVPPPPKKVDPVLKRMMKILSDAPKRVDTSSKNIRDEKSKITSTRNETQSMARAAKKLSRVDGPNKDRILEKTPNDLYYQFNYTISTHGHHENGYRSGRKDGSYRSQNENGVDTQVKYLSNEFGHQPNVTFVPQSGAIDEEHALKGYSFRWYW